MRERRGCCRRFVVVICVAVLIKEIGSLTLQEKNQITTGLQAGEAIAKTISSKNFPKALVKIASSLSSYLGALGPFVSFLLTFIPTESAIMEELKKMMARIDNRFDVMESRFNDIERLINWNSVKVNSVAIEQKILVMAKEYELLYKVPKEAVENRKAIFLSNYENDYLNSGTKLYQAVMNAHGTFQEKLGHSVMRYTKNNRNDTQQILLGVMTLLLQAVKIELAFLKLKGFDANAVFMKNQWQSRILNVTSEFITIDIAVRDKYKDQSGTDLLEFAAMNTALSNSDFSKGLFDLLAGKYYWRDWVVLVYNPIAGWDKHTVRICNGHIKFRQNGRNIVISSLDSRVPRMDLSRAQREMNKVKVVYKSIPAPMAIPFPDKPRSAKDIFDNLNKDGACQVSVIKSNSNIHYNYTPERFISVTRWPFKLNMWG